MADELQSPTNDFGLKIVLRVLAKYTYITFKIKIQLLRILLQTFIV